MPTRIRLVHRPQIEVDTYGDCNAQTFPLTKEDTKEYPVCDEHRSLETVRGDMKSGEIEENSSAGARSLLLNIDSLIT